MRRHKWKQDLLMLLLSAVAAVEIAVCVDFTLAWQEKSLSVTVFAALAAGAMTLIYLLSGRNRKRAMGVIFGYHVLLAALAAALIMLWRSFSGGGVYQKVDDGKARLFAERTVMLIVPHQDDDINVLGGVMEEYAAYGSRVYPVFVTNGDNEIDPQIRFREVMDVMSYIGIPEENVIFLGYGDQWKEGGPHLYNAQPGVVMESFAGKTETYGTAVAPAFREGRSYTVEHLLEDLEAAILSVKPDVIFCSDYDTHIDHKATTLAFEKVMGRILREYLDYEPLVFKGYAYKTAWYAEPDYYEINVRSTQDVFAEPYLQRPQVYRWEDRVRLPVAADTLSRSIFSGGTYQTLELYASQEANLQAGGIINSDKVFWQRRTESLSYRASVEVSSGQASAALLNDFMLVENHNLTDPAHMPYDGVWVPEGEDEIREVTMTLEEPMLLNRIVLYDNPSETDNVLNALIRFDDGTQIQSGPLHPGGAATVVEVNKEHIRSFTVHLLQTEGEKAGLTEIEVYDMGVAEELPCIKLMDENGDFAYDYWLGKEGRGAFSLYTAGNLPQLSEGAYTVTGSNPLCTVEVTGDMVLVSCPEGEETVVRISSEEHGMSDSVLVRNPGKWQRLSCTVCQKLEELIFQGYCSGVHWSTATYKVLDLVRDMIPALAN